MQNGSSERGADLEISGVRVFGTTGACGAHVEAGSRTKNVSRVDLIYGLQPELRLKVVSGQVGL